MLTCGHIDRFIIVKCLKISKIDSKNGSWVKPGKNGRPSETLYPDLGHPAPIGPHWDYKDPSGKK